MAPSVAERQAALERRFPRWRPLRLDQLLAAVAAESPDRPYVITDDRSFSYAEIDRWATRIAGGLRRAGVRPGEHVALVMANFPEFVAVRYAIARVGAVCVPVNFLNRCDELGYVLRQSGAVALVTMDRFRDLEYLSFLDQLAPGWERAGGGDRIPALRTVVVHPTESGGGRPGAATLDSLSEGPEPDLSHVDRDASCAADILYTSGTTGEPKGVLLTHDMLLRTAYASAFSRAFSDSHRITFSLPMYHVFGYVEGMLSVLFVGGSIVPQVAFGPASTLRAVERHRATDALLIPTMTMAVLDELAGGGYDISSLTSLISSGGTSPAGLWERLEKVFDGVELTTGYGMSETTATTALTRPDDPAERRRATNGRVRDAGVAGDPDRGARLVEYRAVDPESRVEVPRGEVGELLARGPGVTAGYYRKPEETAAVFADGDGWLRTGDLARIDADDYITLAGRVKESYRCGGEQVMPKEVEDVLCGHPTVAQAYVVPLPDDRMGEVGAAWIVLRAGAELDPDELVRHCTQRLARFKVPRHVLPIAAEDIPATPSGRPRKFLLAERATALLKENG
ncbi:MAG TPA: class I adenylate-forming enzyme family protein [Pseudonocardia sp.]|jgi:fatty-acyl-CoA synthase|nr:class I adenylate-forming enzyme family protein [Pseudonocardia sp.]